MRNIVIQYYHAHLYFDEASLEKAIKLGDAAKNLFGTQIGRYHKGPVGPHPGPSCQLTVPKDKFSEVIPWLCLNRGDLDVFVHPVTGDDLLDHTNHVIWLGNQHQLKLDIF